MDGAKSTDTVSRRVRVSRAVTSVHQCRATASEEIGQEEIA